MNLKYKGLVLVALPLIFQFVFLGILILQLKEAEHEVDRQVKARTVITVADQLSKQFLEADVALAGFNGTRSPLFEERFTQNYAAIPETLKRLDELLPDSSENRALVQRLSTIVQEGVSTLAKARASLDSDSSNQEMRSAELHNSMRFIVESLEKELRDATKSQRKIDDEAPSIEKHRRAQLIFIISLAAIFSVVCTSFLAIFFARGIGQRLDVIIDNTRRLSTGRALRSELKGADEIATVDHSFHEMVVALKDASNRKEELLAIVSHDLRGPLTSLELTADLFTRGLMGDLNERGNKGAARNLRSIRSLTALINDLLDFDKLESGALPMNKKLCPVEPIFQHVADTLFPIAEEKEIRFEFTGNKQEALIDPDRIGQVLTNLAMNAMKFSPPKSIVSFSAEPFDNGVLFKVKDQGRGIPAEKLSLVFDRFYQVNEADGKQGAGTGLGLAICKGFVEAHGGTIGVDSRPGDGATFWFHIHNT